MLAPWVQELLQEGPDSVRVQLSPDVGVDLPVEVYARTGPGYVSAQALGLSVGLEGDLLRWQRWYEGHVDTSQEPMEQGSADEWADWRHQGDSLVQRLQEELGPGFEVRPS